METQQNKKCQFCGEEILREAKKCRFCGEWLGDAVQDVFSKDKSEKGNSKWYKRAWMLPVYIIGTVAILAIIINNIPSNQNVEKNNVQEEKQDVSKADAPTEKPQEKKIYKMKEAVQVGNFVHYAGEMREEQEVGASFSRRKALGVYKIITIVAMNISNESRYLDSNMFKLIDSKGRIYDYSVDGGIALSSMGNQYDLFLKQISPSLKTPGVVIFDVPKDAEGLKLEVSGGFGSSEKRLIELQ